MINVILQLWPGGDKTKAEDLGHIEIINDLSTGTTTHGNYDVRLHKWGRARRPGVWKRGRVEGFRRVEQGPYDLLFRALLDTVGDRNRDALPVPGGVAASSRQLPLTPDIFPQLLWIVAAVASLNLSDIGSMKDDDILYAHGGTLTVAHVRQAWRIIQEMGQTP